MQYYNLCFYNILRLLFGIDYFKDLKGLGLLGKLVTDHITNSYIVELWSLVYTNMIICGIVTCTNIGLAQ